MVSPALIIPIAIPSGDFGQKMDWFRTRVWTVHRNLNLVLKLSRVRPGQCSDERKSQDHRLAWETKKTEKNPSVNHMPFDAKLTAGIK